MKAAETSEFCDFLASVYESQSCLNIVLWLCDISVNFSLCRRQTFAVIALATYMAAMVSICTVTKLHKHL